MEHLSKYSPVTLHLSPATRILKKNENFDHVIDIRVLIPLRVFNPFAPGDFAEKRVLKLVEWFSGHCRAIKSQNLPQSGLQVVHLAAF